MSTDSEHLRAQLQALGLQAMAAVFEEEATKAAKSQKPTARANLAPPALIAAILIRGDSLFEIAANSSLPPRLSQQERYASASPAAWAPVC